MITLSIWLAGMTAPILLAFKGEDTARGTLANYETMGPQDRCWLKDDFGNEFHIHKPAVVGVLLQDMKQAREADIERGVFQAITQAKANERAKADPTLQAHFRSQQGPAVLSPMGGMMPGFRQ